MSTPYFEGTNPLIADRFVNTYIAGEDLVVGVLVELTADWTVKKPTTQNSKKVVGITSTAAKNGSRVSVIARGIARIIPYTSLSAGDQFGSAASGGTAIQDNTSVNATILGQCIQGGNSAGTAIVCLW
jgi:hypothetical protein